MHQCPTGIERENCPHPFLRIEKWLEIIQPCRWERFLHFQSCIQSRRCSLVSGCLSDGWGYRLVQSGAHNLN